MIDLEIWKESEVISGNHSVKDKIFSIITDYFLFKNIELKAENSAIIVQAIYDYCKTKHRFKVYDLEMALKNNRVNNENNISAAHILGLMEIYVSSQARREFLKTIDNEGQKKLEPVKFNEENILQFAKENLSLIQIQFKRTGKVSYSMSDTQFELLAKDGYFSFVKESKDQLNELAIDDHLKELENFL